MNWVVVMSLRTHVTGSQVISCWSANSGLKTQRLWRRVYEVSSGASCLAAWICWKCFARVGKVGQGRIETKAAQLNVGA